MVIGVQLILMLQHLLFVQTVATCVDGAASVLRRPNNVQPKRMVITTFVHGS